jgi:hypothetical protein
LLLPSDLPVSLDLSLLFTYLILLSYLGRTEVSVLLSGT